jgi:hypothetical protein
MPKKLYAVRVTITYDGVGTSPEQALKDAWNTISNDAMFRQAQVEEKEIDVEETSFDPAYLKEISEED